jgi:hypothetical protein
MIRSDSDAITSAPLGSPLQAISQVPRASHRQGHLSRTGTNLVPWCPNTTVMRLQIVDVLSVNPQNTSGWHSPTPHALQELATYNG